MNMARLLRCTRGRKAGRTSSSLSLDRHSSIPINRLRVFGAMRGDEIASSMSALNARLK